MKRFVVYTALLSLTIPGGLLNAPAIGASSKAAQSTSHTQSDDDAIRAGLAAIGKNAAAGDAAALASMWVADGTYTDDSGRTFTGTDALKERFAQQTGGNKAAGLTLKEDHIRRLSDTVIIADGMVVRKEKEGRETPDTRFSIVWTKRNGKWMIASATETAIEQAEANDYLNDLSWLVGDWKAERNGGTLRIHATWAGNKNFIRCNYEITRPGQPAQEDTEVIGFDPRTQDLVSWNFDSTGAFGNSTWQKNGKQWRIDSSKITKDGMTLTAHNVISMNGHDSFTWQSQDRTAGGVPLSDTQELQIVRAAK
jgi:uncharacterized protein (TIGR02246 family)